MPEEQQRNRKSLGWMLSSAFWNHAAAYIEPPLTTICQPMREVGSVAARLLIERIERQQSAREVVLLKPELVQRGT